jgi:hypothetical protein
MGDVKCQTDLEMEGSLKAGAPTRLETDTPHSHIRRAKWIQGAPWFTRCVPTSADERAAIPDLGSPSQRVKDQTKSLCVVFMRLFQVVTDGACGPAKRNLNRAAA